MTALREGDTRPACRPDDVPLRFRPIGNPFRWLPRHGDPFCYLELTAQRFVKAVARLDVYTAVVVTLCLIVLVSTR